MAFNVEFHPGVPGDASPDEILAELKESYETVIMDVCELLAESDGARFILQGFGRENRPVDVNYDMSVFAEYLPELLECIREGQSIEVDIYSQGIESKLTFVPDDEDVAIRCDSRTDWVPDPDVEHIARTDLLAMLEQMASTIARAMRDIDLRLVSVAPFDEWLATPPSAP